MTETTIANLALAKLGAEQITSLNALNSKEATHAKLHFAQVRDEVLRDHPWQFAQTSAPLVFTAPAASENLSVLLPDAAAYRTFTATLTVDTYSYEDSATGVIAVVECNLEDGTTGDRWAYVEDGDILAQAQDEATHPCEVLHWLEPVTYEETELKFKEAARGVWHYSYRLPSDCLRIGVIRAADDGRKVDSFARGYCHGGQAILTHQAPDINLTYTARIEDPNQFDPQFVDAFATLLASRMARAITGSDSKEAELLAIYKNEALPSARFRDAQETVGGENRDTLADMLEGDLLPKRSSTGAGGKFFPRTQRGVSLPAPDLDGIFESGLE